jgi:lysyl-tRNA synthetase, class II
VSDTPAVPESDLPEQMRVRRDKRARLLDEGREPYPVGVPRTHTLTQVREAYGHLKVAEETH